MMKQFSESIIKKVAADLKQYASDTDISDLYQWPIDKAINEHPDIFGKSYTISGTAFQKTMSIRQFINEKLLDSSISEIDQKKLILWIIKVWGGIRGVGESVIVKNIIDKEKKKKELAGKDEGIIFDFPNIASWSKYFSFKYPKEYAIYDARVIYSLNWLLFEAGESSESGKFEFFPVPEGRNSLMNALDYTMLFLLKKNGFKKVQRCIIQDINYRNKKPGAKSRAITKLKKNVYINKDSAYVVYCNLLLAISKELFDTDTDALTKTEMILFSIADKYIAERVLIELYDGCVQNSNGSFQEKNDIEEVSEMVKDINSIKEKEIVFGIKITENIVSGMVSVFPFNLSQEVFEIVLRDLFNWLLNHKIKTIVFESGGCLILPDWFIQACKQNGINAQFTGVPGDREFKIYLGVATYNNGYINPGIRVDKFIGDHDEPMTVYLRNQDKCISSKINRNAVRNGSARIYGGANLRDWFRENYQSGDSVNASVLSQNEIIIL